MQITNAFAYTGFGAVIFGLGRMRPLRDIRRAERPVASRQPRRQCCRSQERSACLWLSTCPRAIRSWADGPVRSVPLLSVTRSSMSPSYLIVCHLPSWYLLLLLSIGISRRSLEPAARAIGSMLACASWRTGCKKEKAISRMLGLSVDALALAARSFDRELFVPRTLCSTAFPSQAVAQELRMSR